jgi:hypothetical protein
LSTTTSHAYGYSGYGQGYEDGCGGARGQGVSHSTYPNTGSIAAATASVAADPRQTSLFHGQISNNLAPVLPPTDPFKDFF